MINLTTDDLRDALRDVRDAAEDLRRRGWRKAANDMHAVIYLVAPVLLHVYAFGREMDLYRGQLAIDCQMWMRTYAHSQAAPTNIFLQSTGVDIARKMIERADALLAYLQQPRQ